MNDKPKNLRTAGTDVTDAAEAPVVVDRVTFQAELDALRVREKAHTHEGDAIAAARRRLPMVEVDSTLPLIGPHGPVTLASSYESDFNADLGFSSSPEQTREAIEPMLDDLSPVAFRNAQEAGTDIYGYLTDLFGFSASTLQDRTVYQTYSTTGRGS